MEGDYPVEDEESCIGCSVCAHFCQGGAVKMVERAKKIIPPKAYKNLMVRLVKEKGRVWPI